MSASLSIIVYKGSPVDAPDLRHTALFLDFPGSNSLLLHIVGTSGIFQPQVKQNEDPSKSQKFVRKIAVAKIQGRSRNDLQSRIMATPIKNSDKSWNCQHWIGDALVRLSNPGWISSSAREAAVDTMADVVTDAPDES